MAKQEEGLVYHCVGVRYRVTGAGNFYTKLHSFDEQNSTQLADVILQSATAYLPSKLANFRSQGMQVEFGVDEIEDTFVLDRIVVYIKPTTTGYPQS
jgi:hypothetical protein